MLALLPRLKTQVSTSSKDYDRRQGITGGFTDHYSGGCVTRKMERSSLSRAGMGGDGIQVSVCLTRQPYIGSPLQAKAMLCPEGMRCRSDAASNDSCVMKNSLRSKVTVPACGAGEHRDERGVEYES